MLDRALLVDLAAALLAAPPCCLCYCWPGWRARCCQVGHEAEIHRLPAALGIAEEQLAAKRGDADIAVLAVSLTEGGLQHGGEVDTVADSFQRQVADLDATEGAAEAGESLPLADALHLHRGCRRHCRDLGDRVSPP
jgi:hypothetical protein